MDTKGRTVGDMNSSTVMGRPRLPDTRHCTVTVRLTVDDKNIITQAAERSSRTVSSYARIVLLEAAKAVEGS